MTASPGPRRNFRTKVFIARSLDGFIARPDGDLDWLNERGERAGDTGYDTFISGIDTIVMGRNTYEKTRTFGFWPYDGLRASVLSTQLNTEDPNITIARNLTDLVSDLNTNGADNVYVDGGQLVQSFLREGLIDDITITTAPVLLGEGIPLFGSVHHDIELEHRATRTLGAGFVQST